MLIKISSLIENQSFRKLCQKMVSTQTVKVQVKAGTIIGKTGKLSNGKPYECFQGIPYAVPPLGSLRFRSPVPLEKFTVPELDCTRDRDASFHRDSFTQEILGSEDCLFLNVYAPTSSKSPRKSLPVMVFIHGGAFFFGSSNSEYLFPVKLMEEEVIVVTLNYRLGAFGFLAFPEAGVWGNMGLKDQRLALQWVHENIAQFNGDPNNVTIFGESAGAGSCHLHCYSSHAMKLFHKAIMQSGSANAEWVFQKDPSRKAYRLAELLGCESKDPHEIMDYMRNEEVTPLHVLANSMPVLTADEKRRGLPMVFRPVIEDSNSPDPIITRPIIELLKTPDILNMPTIFGYNNGEGLGFLGNAIRKAQDVDKDLERFVPRNIPVPLDSPTIKKIAQKMRDFYFKGGSISHRSFNAMSELLADYHFTIEMQNAAEWQVRYQSNAPVYFCRFDYLGKRNYYKRLYKLEKQDGAGHGDDLGYLFQWANDSQPMDAQDELFSQKYCHLWANFAKCGNPTPKGAEPPIIDTAWTAVRRPGSEKEPFELDYYVIDKHCRMEKNLERERINFWRNIYDEFKPTDYSLFSAKL